jgi:hypothetical protein
MTPKMIASFCSLAFFSSVLYAASAPPAFVLIDYLNRAWSNECVEFTMNSAQASAAGKGQALAGPDGKAIPYQVLPGASRKDPGRVVFLADLNPFETRAYRFTNSAASIQTDLKIEETPETIRLFNGRTGISVLKKLKAGQGPIEKIRLQSGQWIGSSSLDPAPGETGYSARIVTQGPVFAEVLCTAYIGEGSRWELRFRLNANEPVVRVDETMAMIDKAGVFKLSLAEGLAPDKVFFRDGKGAIGANIITNIQPGNVFVLEPWLRWSRQAAEGSVFSVYQDSGTDLLAIGAGEAGVWVDPAIPSEKRAAPFVPVMKDDQGLHLDFTLRNGQRKWMIMALDKEASLAGCKTNAWPYVTPLPHQLVIKHGQFPLNAIKEYVLEWKEGRIEYPRLLLSPADVAHLRKTVQDKSGYEKAIPGFLSDPSPLQHQSIGPRIAAYLMTGNAELGAKLATQAVEMAQGAVNTFLKQPDIPYGTAPHNYSGQFMGATPQLIDAVLGSEAVTPAMRRRLLAQMAFIGYTINRADYWSPERGYSANPNMTTSVLGYRMAYACVIPSHPNSKAWAEAAVAGLKEQLFGWSDSSGAWIEAPHYAMVSYDPILASFMMAAKAGMSQIVYDPQMKNVITWFAKVSTPPDSRTKNRRHLPPIGNTYIGEPTGEFGLVAFLWKDRDPAFAAEMQWMFRQHGSWPEAGIGGSYPGFAGYRALLSDQSVPEKAPKYESEMFPKVGVMLRSHFPSERETQMLLLAGSFGGWRSHWDDDSGSFTLWGKGRIIADDYGYYGRAPADDHSLPDAPEIRQTSIYNVTTFAPSKNLDYVNGTRGPWRRQVAFVKSPDPLAPHYFIIRDTLKTAAPAAWRVWFTASNVTAGAARALVEGRDDVDTEVFVASPAGLALKTEERSRTSGSGIDPEGRMGRTSTTQIGLIAQSPTNGSVMAVLYPRLKTEKPPVFTALANGRGVKVESAAGTDYIFLSDTSFVYEADSISFTGTCGLIRLTGKTVEFSLGEGGRIGAMGKFLISEKAATKEETL